MRWWFQVNEKYEQNYSNMIVNSSKYVDFHDCYKSYFDIPRMTFSRARASKTWKGKKKKGNGSEMEKYLLIANRQCIKMNNFRNEYCFQWDLECLFKSNQIKSYHIISNHTFQYHISHTIVNITFISLNLSEWRKI